MNYNKRALEDIYSMISGSIPHRKHLNIYGENNTPKEQKEVEYTIDKIKELLDQINVDQTDMSQMKKLYDRVATFEGYRPIKGTLERKGFGEKVLGKYSGEIQSLIEDLPREDKLNFFKFLEAGSKDDFPESEVGNVYDIIQKLGLSYEIGNQIFSHTGQDAAKRGVGMGELALALLFKNVDAAGGLKSREVAAAEKEKGKYNAQTMNPKSKNYDKSAHDAFLKGKARLQAAKKLGIKGDLELNGKEFEIKGENASLGETSDVIYNKVKSITEKYLEQMGISLVGTTYTVNGKNIGGDLGSFPEAVSMAYKAYENKDGFKDIFKQFLTQAGGLGDAVNSTIFNEINFEKPSSIQRGVSVLNLLRYTTKEGFYYFMAHDIGADGKGAGKYVFASGSPEQIATKIRNNPAVKFEKVKYNALRPRIGFSDTKVNEDNETIVKV